MQCRGTANQPSPKRGGSEFRYMLLNPSMLSNTGMPNSQGRCLAFRANLHPQLTIWLGLVRVFTPPMTMDLTERSENSAYKIQRQSFTKLCKTSSILMLHTPNDTPGSASRTATQCSAVRGTCMHTRHSVRRLHGHREADTNLPGHTCIS